MNKAKKYDISMTLNGIEAGVFDGYCEKSGCSATAGIICLIREFLMNKPLQLEQISRKRRF